SAPTSASQKVRGLEEVRVKIGCAQPGETVATFGDALRRLSEQLTYLYSDGSRYWFDTRPTITRIAADRAATYERKPDIVEDEIIRRLRQIVARDRGEFSAVHTAPSESNDVPDEKSCRLVILSPKYPHRARTGESVALQTAQEILDRRGNSPRLYRNMLLFLSADVDRLPELQQAIRSWLAWTSIDDEKEQLNLDPATQRQVKNQLTNLEETITERLRETYCYLLVPTQEGTEAVVWQSHRLQGENLVGRASRKLISDQQMIVSWSPALLRMELDKWLWKEQEHLSIRQIWEYLTQYLYLSRLKDEQVLIEAVRAGVGSLTWKDFFAYASAVRDDGRYVGLIAGANPAVTLDGASVLVKPETAQRQIDEEAASQSTLQPDSHQPAGTVGEAVTGVISPELTGESAPRVLRRFHGSVELDPTRMGRDAGRIADEVIAHLTSLVGAKAKITLEISVEVPNGIPEDRVRIVSENCNTLKFKGHGFEEG